jgi:hypothetical protein
MINLFDFRCPNCGDESAIDIQAKLWVRVTFNGSDADASGNGDHEFTPESPAVCGCCGHCGTVRDFEEAGGVPCATASASLRRHFHGLDRLPSRNRGGNLRSGHRDREEKSTGDLWELAEARDGGHEKVRCVRAS